MRGVPYVLKAIAWADLVGCPCVDTTDGAFKTKGYTDEEIKELPPDADEWLGQSEEGRRPGA